MLRSLLTLALFAYPKDFRASYRAHVARDLEDRSNESGYGSRLIFDVLSSGLAMRADLMWRDISYAARTLRKAPLFTAVVVGTLAVAIAANTVIFSALDAVLLQPLPFPHADRLFIVYASEKPVPGMSTITNPGVAPGGTRIRSAGGVKTMRDANGREGVPVPLFETAARTSPLIQSFGTSAISSRQVRLDGRIRVLNHGFVSAHYFQTLGITPYIGRFFRPGALNEAIISYELWQSKYGGTRSVVGKLLHINSDAFQIVGVAPPQMFDPSFGAMSKEDMWSLMAPAGPNVRFSGNPIVRLRPGVTLAAFDADLARMWNNYIQQEKSPILRGFLSSVSLGAQPLRDAVVSDTQSLWIVFGAAAVLLLIACANIANLMLARAASRRNEYGMRAALGATARRIAAQSITETLIVSIIGCAIGLAIGAACLRPTIALLPGNLPRLTTAHIDLNVLLYVYALGIGVTLLAGVIPALKTGSSSAPAKRNPRTVRALVALEVAAAFTLLVCSGLLLRSFLAVTSQEIGFDPHHGYIASFLPEISGIGRPQMPDLHAVAPRVTARIRALPGVTEAAITTEPPFTTPYMLMAESQFWLEGQPKPSADDQTHMSSRVEISPDYLSVAGMKIIAGRGFASADLHGQRSVLVNQTFVDQVMKTKHPIGSRLADGTGPGYQVIGVVADTRNSLTQDPTPMVYFPLGAPGLGPNGASASLPFFNVFFRTSHDDQHIATEISNVARQVYSQFDVVPVSSLDQAVSDSAANARAAFLLLAGFTLIAIVLALAGIYGVVAFSVERRYHEIGIRMALGATSAVTLRNVVTGALTQSSLGILLGLIIAAFASQTLQAQLFKIAPLDPASFIGAVLLLLTFTCLASAIPAWRAMRIDPARTLRYE